MSQKPCSSSIENYQPGSLPEVFHLIETLEKKLNHLQGQTLRIAGLTPPQFIVLKLINEKDERPLKDLADELCCTRATVTGIIDTMEKKELVRRLPNKNDRRSMLVKLTDKGHTVMIQSEPQIGRSFENCCDILDLDEIMVLSRLLNKLNRALDF